MQGIIEVIKDAGAEVCLAKIPIALGDDTDSNPYFDLADIDDGPKNVEIMEFNLVIEELIDENSITVTPPDFYNYFKETERYEDQYSDYLHPNGDGYQSMAELWYDVLNP